MSRKTELFCDIPKTIKVILLCGELRPQTRLRLCNDKIDTDMQLLEDEPENDYKISIHGSFEDFQSKDYYEEVLATELLYEPVVTSYLRRANLSLEDTWNYSIVCNAHTFNINKLKRIIDQTSDTVFLHCTRKSIKELYHTLKGTCGILAVDWSNKQSFKEDMLANEFFGRLELLMISKPKPNDHIEGFLKECIT